ncbi:MAG: hypothetical protein ACRC2U_00050 [Aeromonas sp.]
MAEGTLVERVMGYVTSGADVAIGWLSSPAAWSQFGLLALAFVAAVLVTRRALR